MTLADFVKYLVALLNEGRTDMPYEDESPWHELFYDLKTRDEAREKPEFIKNLRFDWDAPYPKSPEVSEYLHALHWSACVTAQNPYYERITLSPEIASFWLKEYNNLDNNEKDYLNEVASIAKERFTPKSENIPEIQPC